MLAATATAAVRLTRSNSSLSFAVAAPARDADTRPVSDSDALVARAGADAEHNERDEQTDVEHGLKMAVTTGASRLGADTLTISGIRGAWRRPA